MGEVALDEKYRIVLDRKKQGYVPNTLKDAHDILTQANAGYVTLESTNIFVNCPEVP